MSEVYETLNARIFNYAFLNSLDLDQDVVNRLSLHLRRTENGSDEIFMTPLAKDHGPESLLKEFDKVFNSNSSKMNSALLDLEESNKAKFGPRSIAPPWSERSKVLDASFDEGNIDPAWRISEGLISRNRLRPITAQKALTLLKNNTNSGLPYYTRKGKVKERVLDKLDTLLKRKDPCILFTRTQEQRKARSVWGFPIADTLNEMRYYSPLLAYQRELPCRAAIRSPDEVGRSLTKLILKAIRLKANLLSIDFSLYDTSVRSQLQQHAFNYVKSLFQRECSPEIDYIADRFRSISIVTPFGVITGDHGVPSGSTFTNEIDSIVQIMVSTSQKGFDLSDDDFQVQGDDGVYLIPQGKLDSLTSQFESCGLSISRDKTHFSSEYAIYLQNLFHIDYIKDGFIGGIYPVYRALNRILYQERWSDFEDFDIKGKDFYSIRTICICENCKHHPLFRELVMFVLKYDKYSLDVSDHGLRNFVQMITETEGGGGILNHQYGDDVKGIKSFETYKLIKELG